MSNGTPPNGPPGPAAPIAGCAEAIERGPLLGIAQDLVGGVELLEPLVRAVVSRVLVGMMLRRELAEGALDLVLGRGAIHTQDVVRDPARRSGIASILRAAHPPPPEVRRGRPRPDAAPR